MKSFSFVSLHIAFSFRELTWRNPVFRAPGHRLGPYIENARVVTDPWGRPYVYHNPGLSQSGYDLSSCGPNGKAGDSDDITLKSTGTQR